MSDRPADPDRWTEARLCAIEPHEHDFQEFKGSGWVLAKGEPTSTFVHALSKQVSAFVNGAGGRLFIGLDDDGNIDGGVPVDLRGGTREWLEDVVPGCVDPPLQSCNVFEVGSTGPDSAVRPGHAVYVVDLPRSDRAPHQAKDHRYYLRIAGKSRPMGHLHVQDVLRRTRHPVVHLCRVGPYGEPELDLSDPRGPMMFVQFRAFLHNEGRTLAHHVGLELSVPRPFVGAEVRLRTRRQGEVRYTQRPGEILFFRHHPDPIFPDQEVYAASVWIALHATNVGLLRSGASLRWRVFADDAPPHVGEQPMGDYQVVQRAVERLAAATEP
jgi:hypothetical protein